MDFRGVRVPRDAFKEYQSTTGQTSYALREKEFNAIVATYDPAVYEGRGGGGGKSSRKPPQKWEGNFADRLFPPLDEAEPGRSFGKWDR